MTVKFRFLFLIAMSVMIFSCKDKQAENNAGAVAAAEGAKFVASPEMTKIMWEGAKPTGTHKGTIGISGGEVFVSNGAVTSGNFTLDMNSITVTDLTGEEKTNLEAHLKGTAEKGADDFFNVTKFPTGKFEITGVEASTAAGANANVKGNLTLRDKTNEISFPANVTVTDSTVTVTAAKFNIDRTKWGVNYGSKNIFKDLGDKFINDEIALEIQFSGKVAPAEAPKQ